MGGAEEESHISVDRHVIFVLWKRKFQVASRFEMSTEFNHVCFIASQGNLFSQEIDLTLEIRNLVSVTSELVSQCLDLICSLWDLVESFSKLSVTVQKSSVVFVMIFEQRRCLVTQFVDLWLEFFVNLIDFRHCFIC